MNSLITDLVQPTSEVSRVIKAVAEGDLSQKVELEIDGKQVQGEFFRIGSTVNRMVDQLNAFASEVTRVAREVGTEGVLGGQANVQGVGGTWKDLTDSVNAMASNLTNQVRNIARRDDGRRQRRPVAEDHRRSARRSAGAEEHDQHDGRSAVGIRGGSDARGARSRNRRNSRRPGERAGVAGTWKDLTDNVNFMAANLTNQVRNIALVTTAVANGDLSQKITVEARRRGARPQGHHQQHGGEAAHLRRRSEPRGARGRNRRRAGRTSERARRGGHVEGPAPTT